MAGMNTLNTDLVNAKNKRSLIAGLLDSIILIKYWLLNWLKIIGFFATRGPFFISDLKKYPWIYHFVKVNSLFVRLVKGRSGNYRKATAVILTDVVSGVIKLLKGIIFNKKKLVIHEDMVPPEILRAMGLSPWMPEILGIILPMVEPSAMEIYIDASENEGIPPDICSLPKSTLGITYKGEMPRGRAMVSSNLPCDGGMASYSIIERKLDIPTYRLDIPHNFKSERSIKHFAADLKSMIFWLEEKTGHKMDWTKLREICTERNRMVELEIELWDMISLKPTPMASEPVYLSHLWAFNVFPGIKSSTELFRNIVKLTKKNLDRSIAAVPNEKFRALLWNPPTLHFLDLFNWAEKAYGVTLIIDSMTYKSPSFINTETNETMLEGLGHNIMEGPMARHTRGPAENYLYDIFHIIKHFNLDMLWVAGHIGCKNTQALNGMLRERCREEGVPLLVIDYDLSDPRIVPGDGIKDQVEHFMENIMRAERLNK